MANKKKQKKKNKLAQKKASTLNFSKQNSGKSLSNKWIGKNHLILLGVLLTGIFIAFMGVLDNELVNYDDDTVLGLVVGGELTTISDFFQRHLFSAHYKPLVFWMWNIEYNLFGDAPFVFHLNNMLLHLINAVLVFVVILKLGKLLKYEHKYVLIGAFFTAFLFGVHPLHVESVAWATERKDLLYSFFYLSALWAYVEYLLEEQKTLKYLLIGGMLYLACILSKSMGITLIAMLFLMDFVAGRKIQKRLFLEKIPFFLVFIMALFLYGLLTDFSRETQGIMGGIVSSIDQEQAANLLGLPAFYQRILIISHRIIFWALHLLIPVKLSIEYPREQLLEMVGVGIHLFPFILLAIGGGAFYFRKKIPLLLWGSAFFIIALAPAISISDLGGGVYLSDRYTYISSLGILIIVVFGLLYLMKNRLKLPPKAHWVLFGLLTFIMAITTRQRVEMWQDSKTLWTDVIEKYPKVALAYLGRGDIYFNEGNYPKALADFNQSINYNRDAQQLPNAYNNRGRCHYKMKNYPSAIKDLNKAIDLKSNFPPPYNNRGNVYLDQKNYPLALSDYNKSIELKPNYTDAYYNRANLYHYAGDLQMALKDYNRAIDLNDKEATYFVNRASTLWKVGKYDEAIKDFTQSLQLDPQFALTYLNRGRLYLEQKVYQKAIQDFNKALQLNANYGEVYYRRAETYQALGKQQEAKNDFQKAAQLGFQ